MKFLTILLFVFTSISPSTLEDEKIVWNENHRLSWSDFKAPHRSGVSYVASTSSGISFSYASSERNGKIELNITVHSNFYPESSWVNPKEASAYILAHEQAHFDISEIHARILRKKISETTFSKKAKEELTNLYKEVDKMRKAMQHLFDKESDHSKIKEKEVEWEAYIKQQLKDYDRWK